MGNKGVEVPTTTEAFGDSNIGATTSKQPHGSAMFNIQRHGTSSVSPSNPQKKLKKIINDLY
eukprot:c15693_g2_i1 orf=226-411(-)